MTLRGLGLDGAAAAVVSLDDRHSVLPRVPTGDATLRFTGAPLSSNISAALVAG
jgi:hypothetical protein